ncbi:45 kDa calcium-binding protein-like [Babylonia areolata]|uniref:45 kDa calcium-binding protein-like n=1 Tax=Babylonia areolata TaxID=304850 RepID=UPI003FD1FD1D
MECKSVVQIFLLVSLALHLAAAIPFRNVKPPPGEPDANAQHVDPADVENDIGDPKNDKAEDLDKGDKEDDKDENDDQGRHVIGDDKDDDNDDDNEEKEQELKFVKIPDGVEKLPVEKLRPVDHIDAVRMEQDGHINKDFHKEMFLGNHEEFEKDRYEEAESKLKDIVYKVDSDKDGKLSVAELEAWVNEKMEEHFSEATQENEEIFKHLDPDNNGKVHWKEYYVHFLLAKGFKQDLATRHVVDYDQIQLDPDAKEELIRYKFRWADADTEPMDNELTKEEFMSFRHPEQSEKTLNNMVVSILGGIDTNGDGVITEDEFAALPPGEVEGEEYQAMDKAWQKERQEEFRSALDLDHSGKVTKEELKRYLDPRNPIQALTEAKNLISYMDDDKDNALSMDEILRHKDIFISSKVMNFAANVHDEF